jgi:AcrR family transcriptional regulator
VGLGLRPAPIAAIVERKVRPDGPVRCVPAAMTLVRFRPTGSPRERILHATAATVRQKGYRAVTVTDIVSAARISRRSFYNQFPSKADAFIATYEHGFEQAIAACAPAFFAERAWPERVGHAAQAFNPVSLARAADRIPRFRPVLRSRPAFYAAVHDTQLAFTMFLEDGYRQRCEAQSLSRACSSLTAATIFEVAFRGIRSGSSLRVAQMQPLAVYIALVPFVGRDEAGAFVVRELSARDSGAPQAV